MSAHAQSMFPMLSAADLDASLAFYREVLGGVLEYRFPEDDPVFVTLRLGVSELGIGALRGEPIHGQPQRPASGHRIELCVYVDDVDATVEEARRHGAPVVLEPRDQPWGERIAYIADPDGNLLMLACKSQA
jgi:lactoylglutathione lyase